MRSGGLTQQALALLAHKGTVESGLLCIAEQSHVRLDIEWAVDMNGFVGASAAVAQQPDGLRIGGRVTSGGFSIATRPGR